MVYKIYGYTKGRIDFPDQLVRLFTSKLKTRKWVRVAKYLIQVEPMRKPW